MFRVIGCIGGGAGGQRGQLPPLPPRLRRPLTVLLPSPRPPVVLPPPIPKLPPPMIGWCLFRVRHQKLCSDDDDIRLRYNSVGGRDDVIRDMSLLSVSGLRTVVGVGQAARLAGKKSVDNGSDRGRR